MKTIVITGGIATGKSTALEYLKSLDSRLIFFDSDAVVSSYLDSGSIAEELKSVFGEGSVLSDGKANRNFLRELVFHNPEAKKKLESILHPKIRQECLALKEDTVKNTSASGFIVDIPLFYETGFDIGQDLVVVVSITRQTQLERLALRNGFSPDLSDSILKAQLPLSEKEKKADVILWNEGPKNWLHQQIDLFYHHYLL